MYLTRNFCITVYFAIIAIVIFWLSNNVMWINDDYVYQFIYSTDGFANGFHNAERIETLSDVFRSQSLHYVHRNGRWVAHVLVQLFDGILGQTIFAVCNSIIYLLFTYIVAKFMGQINFCSLLSIACLIIYAFRTHYFPSTQIGYVWMAALTCLWLYLYFKENSDRVRSYEIFILFIFSVLAGNGQEAYNVGISGAFIIHHILNYRKLTVKQWTMFFGFGIGALFLCLAPSTLNRANSMQISFVYSVYIFLTSLRLFYILIILLIISKIKGLNIPAFNKQNFFWINCILITIVFNLFIGIYCSRQLYCIELISLFFILKLLPQISIRNCFLLVFSIFTICFFIANIQVVSIDKCINKTIENEWVNSKDGVLYYDIPSNKLAKWVQPCVSIGWYEASNGKDFIANTFVSYLQKKYDTDKQLRIYPTVMRDENVKNQAIDLGYGCYFLLQDKANPGDFAITREYKFLCFSYPRDTYSVSFEGDRVIENEKYRAVIFKNATPLLNNTGVIINPRK